MPQREDLKLQGGPGAHRAADSREERSQDGRHFVWKRMWTSRTRSTIPTRTEFSVATAIVGQARNRGPSDCLLPRTYDQYRVLSNDQSRRDLGSRVAEPKARSACCLSQLHRALDARPARHP